MSRPVLATQPVIMGALMEAFVPAAASLPPDQRVEVLERADQTLRNRPSSLKRQLGLAMRALALLGFLRFGRSLAAVPLDRRRRFLQALQDGPILPIRLAVWGLRTLIYAGYYGDPERQREIGYRPSPLGWAARTPEDSP